MLQLEQGRELGDQVGNRTWNERLLHFVLVDLFQSGILGVVFRSKQEGAGWGLADGPWEVPLT